MAAAGSLAAALTIGAGGMVAKASQLQPLARLRDRLRGAIYTPNDAGYSEARRGRGTTPVENRSPAVIVQPKCPDDIAYALDFAAAHGLEISVRSGGHDLLGASTTATGLLIDLSSMSIVSVDPETGVARVGAGTRAGPLTAAAAAHGRAPTLGMNPNVGVGGLTLGGGMGWLSGKYGATVDNLLAVDLVTASGRAIRADANENPELFWALRGGGGNFGIATAFTYQTHPVAHVLAGNVGYKVDPRKFLAFLRDFLADSPDELDLGVLFTLGPNPTAIVRLCWSGAIEEGERALLPLRRYAPAVIDTIKPQTYLGFTEGGPPHDTLFLRGGEFDGLSDEVIDAFAGVIDKGGPKDCLVGVLHYLHGALCRVPSDATPFIREPGHILYNVVAPWQGPMRQTDKVDWALAASEALRHVNSSKIYINYLSYEGGSYVRDAFGPHYDRLLAVKRKYDPDNIFHNNRNIKS